MLFLNREVLPVVSLPPSPQRHGGSDLRNEPISRANMKETKIFPVWRNEPNQSRHCPVAHLRQTRYSLGYMKTSNGLWKECLQGRIAQPLASELDKFESEVLLKKAGKMEDKVFAETRRRRGA